MHDVAVFSQGSARCTVMNSRRLVDAGWTVGLAWLAVDLPGGRVRDNTIRRVLLGSPCEQPCHCKCPVTYQPGHSDFCCARFDSNSSLVTVHECMICTMHPNSWVCPNRRWRPCLCQYACHLIWGITGDMRNDTLQLARSAREH